MKSLSDALPKSQAFGRVGGCEAHLYTLENAFITAEVTDYGGRLVSIKAPDDRGGHSDVLLGFADAQTYADTLGSFGALLGRNANRIAGGRFVMDGSLYALSVNENGSTLHGGTIGFSRRFWSCAAHDRQSLVLTLISGDGDQGFPGEVEVSATYRLIESDLRLSFDARTTRPTPLSLSAHPYFNLAGPGVADCLGHCVQILADTFLPTDEQQIPTGERRSVRGTPFDFTMPQAIGARIRWADAQLRIGRGYDHYFVLAETDSPKLRLAARAFLPGGGRTLEIWTTQRGLQFYTGNNLNGTAIGRDGLYRQSAGFAFEPQGFPNAVNQPDFPSTIHQPGSAYHEEIVYRFRTDSGGAPA